MDAMRCRGLEAAEGEKSSGGRMMLLPPRGELAALPVPPIGIPGSSLGRTSEKALEDPCCLMESVVDTLSGVLPPDSFRSTGESRMRPESPFWAFLSERLEEIESFRSPGLLTLLGTDKSCTF